jgi:hypothetical protein
MIDYPPKKIASRRGVSRTYLLGVIAISGFVRAY